MSGKFALQNSSVALLVTLWVPSFLPPPRIQVGVYFQVSYCIQACQKEDWPEHKSSTLLLLLLSLLSWRSFKCVIFFLVCHVHKQRKAANRAIHRGTPIPRDTMPIF